MEFEQHRLSFQFQARYFTIGPSRNEAVAVFLCLHGYGQLARYFIKKFECIADTSLVIVPEGLHRFYLNGNEGRVGASWMTKEDRVLDIENYLVYLDVLVDHMLEDLSLPLVVIGFSQGAATAGRWVAHTEKKVRDLVLWSGMFPHDVDVGKDMEKWNDKKIYAMIGDEDPYVGDERFIAENERLELSGLHVDRVTFSGGHEIPPKVLVELKDRILRKD